MTDNNNNLTIGHYAFHRNTGNANLVKHGPVTFEVNKDMDYTPKMEPGWKYKPSELELRIRREVMNAVDEMYDSFVTNHIDSIMKEQADSLLLKIKDRLNLLWGCE